MSLSFLFWLIFILCLLFGAYVRRGAIGAPLVWGSDLLMFILIGLLGFQVFGAPIR
jgi:hypothetical protein